jgi:uncharacterized protein YcbK (DUF882 family)
MGDPGDKGRQRLRHSTAPLSVGLSLGVAIAIAVVSVAGGFAGVAQSREPDRTLKLYFGHTGERDEFTYKRNGRYDRRVLEKINHFLRDWRKNEPTRMDPTLLDLVWTIYRKSGSGDYIHVISAYRSPGTNDMLRSRSSGVAKSSQHTHGKALDFYLPDVPLDKLRAIAMKAQGGGVGYYPRSGSPFVHVDTGSVRAWPRMSRSQLLALFPNGETLHLPADGQPLPGYERALAARSRAAGSTTLAYLEPEAEDTDQADSERNPGWLSRVFTGRKKDTDEAVGSAETPAARSFVVGEPTVLVATTGLSDVLIEPQLPRARPATDAATAIAALIPATTVTQPPEFGAIATLAFAPLPRSRPEAAALAETLVAADPSASPLLVDEADMLVALIANGDSAEVPRFDPPSSTPTGAPSQSAEISNADRMILAAFAAIEGTPPTAPSARLKTLTADVKPVTPAVEQASATPPLSEPAPSPFVPPMPSPSPEPAQTAASDIVATPATYDEEFTQLAMPDPTGPGIYAQPVVAAASELSGGPAIPIDHFGPTRSNRESDRGSFLSKLFTSLIQ